MSEHKRVSGLVCASLVVFAVLAGAAAIPAVSAQATTDTSAQVNTTTSDERATATFNQTTVSEERGDIAAIELNLTNTTTAIVSIGSEPVNYETNVTVEDGNDDGNVTLLMNTFIAGRGETESAVYATVAANDSVIRVNRTTEQLNAPLDTSTYNLTVTVDGNVTDMATLRLTERTTGRLITWTAPAGSFGNITNASAVATAVKTGRITTTDTVAVGDVLVLQFKLSGIYGALEAANFTQLVKRGALDLTMVQTNPGPNHQPTRLAVRRSIATDAIHVIPDEGNDILYINIDTGAAAFTNGNLTPGDKYEVTLTLNGKSDLAANDTSLSSNVTIVGTELSFGEVTLAAGPNQTVAGTTSLAPGSEVTVRLQNNGTGSFIKTNTTTVKPNGTFVAEFNLTDIASNTTVSVVADGPLNTSDRTTVTIQPYHPEKPVVGTASLVFPDQQSTGETITVRNVTLPAGGFVVVHAPNVSSAPVESVLGASSYINGTAERIEISLDAPITEDTRLVVMAHRDTNDNQVYDFSGSNGTEDGPYTAGGEPITESAQVTVVAATKYTPSAETTGVGTTTSENGPGFGVVLTAVAVFLVVASLAWRERS